MPLDVVKTRLQTDPGRYAGLLDAAWKISRTEGVGMLLQGLGPTAAGYAVQGGLKYGLYELFKTALAAGGPTSGLALLPLLLAAAGAELVGSTALCPYESARIRLVAEPSFAPGLFPALRRLLAEQGLHGVFGSLPAMYLKMVPYTCAQLVTYDSATRWLAAQLAASPAAAEGGWGTVGVAVGGAAAAALVASLASQPGDTLLSKLNQGRRALRGGAGGGAAAARLRKQGSAVGAPVTSSDEEVPDVTLHGAPDAAGEGEEEGEEGRAGAPAAACLGCGPMCALAARLGPAGLMLGWQARLAHTGTIVLFQLLVYDGVKGALGLPVAAHGAVHVDSEVARLMML